MRKFTSPVKQLKMNEKSNHLVYFILDKFELFIIHSYNNFLNKETKKKYMPNLKNILENSIM